MSQADFLLHQYEVSPFAAKVRRAMHYKKIPFQVHNYAITDAGKIRKTVSESGKTPVLAHAGELIIDSTTILRYLEQVCPEPALLPDDPALIAQIHFMEDWADESLFFYDLVMRGWPNNIDWLANDVTSHDSAMLRGLMKKLVPSFVRKTGTAQGIGRKDKDTICSEVDAHFAALEALLQQSDFLVGNALSLADISVAAMCTVIERAEEAKALMSQREQLMSWRERVDALTFPEGTAPEARATT